MRIENQMKSICSMSLVVRLKRLRARISTVYIPVRSPTESQAVSTGLNNRRLFSFFLGIHGGFREKDY